LHNKKELPQMEALFMKRSIPFIFLTQSVL
jgi:hypothetical protein